MGKHWFISYARADGKDFAFRLHDQLEGDGFTCWLDLSDEGIRPGAIWDETIDQALREASGLLFVMTPGSVISPICGDEWNRALSFKLPVIPLKVEECEAPLRLARRQWIDFTGDFNAGIARLRTHLRWLENPEGELRTLIDRRDDLRRDLERDPDNPRLQKALRDLEETIAYKERALADPNAVEEENRRALEVGLQAELRRQQQDRERARALTRQRVIGSAPQGISEFFKDRVRPAAEINNLLLENAGLRAVSIYGKGGVGKTALACKVLDDLERDFDHVFGVIYASARPGLDISLEQLFLGSTALFGGEVGERLLAAWTNPAADSAAKNRTLLDAYATAIPEGQRVVILLDNLEEKLDDQGCIRDPDLRSFVDMFLESRHSARLLITSREPLCVANQARRYERIFPLDEGLPEPDALELLADFDPNGEIGLRDAAPDDLKEVVRRTLGFPRALEAVAGILDSDPLMTLPKLLADRDLWAREVTEALVSVAQSRLDADAGLVIQALAVYGEPVTEAAVRFLLEPFVKDRGLDIGATIRRLARGRYIAVQRATGHLVLHPLDQEANYRQIPRDPALPVNVIQLEQRAADYFVQLRTPPAEWKRLDDLRPQLAEFEHRVRAGDEPAAFYLLSTLDYDYLLLWGHARKVVTLREKLRGRLDAPPLETVNFNQLGIAYNALGEFQKSLACYQEALRLVREMVDRRGEAVVLGNMGSVYWSLADYVKAIEVQQQAMETNRALGNRKSESFNLNALGLNYSALGQRRKAIECYEASLRITREIGDRRGEPATLVNLGSAYQDMGKLAKAQEYFFEAVGIDQEIGARPEQGIHLGKLGHSHLLQGQAADALACARQALDIAREVGDRSWEIWHLQMLGLIALESGDLAAAQDHARQGVSLADQSGDPMSLNLAYSIQAEVLLHTGDLDGALNAITIVRRTERPGDRLFGAVVQGTILARQGQREAARAVFDEALGHASDQLQDMPELIWAKYAQALALAGLALVGDSPAGDAEAAFRVARAGCDAVGVLARNRRRLDYLTPVDAEGRLARARAVLA